MQPLKRAQVIQLLERVLQAVGAPTMARQDWAACGQVWGVTPLLQIQLQGRWNSRASDRNVQLAPLLPLLKLPETVRTAASVVKSQLLRGSAVLALSDDEPPERLSQRAAGVCSGPFPEFPGGCVLRSRAHLHTNRIKQISV